MILTWHMKFTRWHAMNIIISIIKNMKNNHVPNFNLQCIPWKANRWSGFIDPGNSLPRSKELSIRPFPEPSESSPNPHTRLLKDPFQFYRPIYLYSLACFFSWGFSTQMFHISHLVYKLICYCHLIQIMIQSIVNFSPFYITLIFGGVQISP